MTEPQTSRAELHRKRLSRIFSTRHRTFALLVILFVLIVINFIPGGRIYFRNAVYSLLPSSPSELKLPSAPFENGKAHGASRSFSIRLLCRIYLKRIICRNSDEMLAQGSEKSAAIFGRIDRRWTDEAKGISEGSGVDLGTIMLANSFLDMGLWRIGCRQVVLDGAGIVPGSERRLMHAHNLDWDNLGGVGNFLVTIFRTSGGDGRLATVRIGFPGLIGALSIINEKGISMGFNQLGFAKSETQMPVFIAIREIAETCSCFDEAEQRILNMPPGMPFCIVLSDAQTGNAAVYERLNIEVKKRSIIKGVLTADNSPWAGTDLSLSSVDAAARAIASEAPCDHEMMQNILRDNRVLLACNIYSVIFDYSNNRFYLAAGKIPAASGKFQQYSLF